ncbi:MAG: hypothetical protein IK003_05470 [Prevotella sp.]|nr:hypothetical protein [Prevotella sp.]
MKDSIFKFIEQNDAHEKFDQHLTNDAMGQIMGGRMQKACGPWSDCDAWHCGPDCTCKSNLC